jgi:hypothetical protein
MRFTVFFDFAHPAVSLSVWALHKPGSLRGIGGDLQRAPNMEFD